MNYDILVNKDNLLGKDYVPDNLVLYTEYNGVKVDPSYKTYINKDALEAFYEMNEDAQKYGYYFIVDSSYRSYVYQINLLKDLILKKGANAYKRVAIPGSSEHQTGLAIDVALKINGSYTDIFDDTFKEIKWLHQNMYKYGFILRYPKGYEDITGFDYEYWHIRFVGKEISMYMHDHNIKTFEEYYERNNLHSR